MKLTMDRGSSHAWQDHPKFDQLNVTYLDYMHGNLLFTVLLLCGYLLFKV